MMKVLIIIIIIKIITIIIKLYVPEHFSMPIDAAQGRRSRGSLKG